MLTCSKTFIQDAFGVETNPDSNDTNPFRYCSEYYDTETGNYFLRFRYYAPSTARFISEDPATAGLNWYVYCNNSPVAFIDPWGLTPARDDAAILADHIYRAEGKHIGQMVEGTDGWYLLEIYNPTIVYNKSTNSYVRVSLKIGVYRRIDSDGIAEYAIVNKGTTSSSPMNWLNNVAAMFGGSYDVQYSKEFAMNRVAYWRDINPDVEVTMVGHSKGGAEAMYNAVYTDTNCITFNSAPTSFTPNGLSAAERTYRAKLASGERTMTHYVVSGEVLNWVFGPSSLGKTETVKTQFWFDPTFTILWWTLTSRKEPDRLQNHPMGAFFKAWGLKEAI